MDSNAILMFGQNPELLEIRTWVLEKAGYVVAGVSTLPGLKDALAVRGWGLVILCHTVSELDCRAVVSLAASEFPPVPVLVLQTGSFGYAPAFAESANVLNGPKSLLLKVHSLFHPFRNLTPASSEESFPCQSTSAV